MRCVDMDLLTSIALALPENPVPVLQHVAGCEECQAAVLDCQKLRGLLLDSTLTEHRLREMVVAALDLRTASPQYPMRSGRQANERERTRLRVSEQPFSPAPPSSRSWYCSPDRSVDQVRSPGLPSWPYRFWRVLR